MRAFNILSDLINPVNYANIISMWIWLVLLYGILKGVRDIIKKLALRDNSVMEVLLVYTSIGLLLLLPEIGHVGGLAPKYYFYIMIKSFVIFLAWTFSFISIKKLPVSLYGVLDLSRVLFSTLLAVTFLNEILTPLNTIGLILVCFGLILLGRRKSSYKTSSGEKIPIKFFILALLSCMLNSVSALLDKILMKDIESIQLQFWYMLFLVIFYLLYILISRTKINPSVLKNKWVWILAALFILADRALFTANSMQESRITLMTLIKQSGCVIMIAGGKIVFKEKDILYKSVCAAIIIVGIIISVSAV